ncbi:MAG: MFS transporter [Gammaproteobacteria bacterium]|nr:MFS transporter [Gammaproteobacteria bacterium]
MAVGGEFCGCMVYLSEYGGVKKVGFYGCFCELGSILGLFFGVTVSLVIKYFLSEEMFYVWGWRFAFLFSIIIAFVTYKLRKIMPESAVFLKQKKSKQGGTNILHQLLPYKWEFMQAIGISVHAGVCFWVVMTYVVTYYTKVLNYSYADVFIIDFIGILFAAVALLIAGKLSEKIQIKQIIMAALIGFIALTYLINVEVIAVHRIQEVAVLHWIMCFFVGMYLSLMPAQLALLFPAHVRYTGLALAYNLALAIFGGTSPIIITYLISSKTTLFAPGIVVTISAFISLVALLFVDSSKDINR